MGDDVVMPSNLLVTPIEEEEFEETPFDVNVSQWLHDEKPFKRVVCTRVDRSTWDHRLSPNPHTLAIYLEFVFTRGTMSQRFEKCQCEDDNVRFHYRTWFSVMAIIDGYKAPSTPSPWNIELNT